MKIGSVIEFIDKTPGQFSHDHQYVYMRNCKVKDPQTRQWYDAAMYMQYNGTKHHNPEIYIRELNEFNKKFKEVDTE